MKKLEKEASHILKDLDESEQLLQFCIEKLSEPV